MGCTDNTCPCSFMVVLLVYFFTLVYTVEFCEQGSGSSSTHKDGERDGEDKA